MSTAEVTRNKETFRRFQDAMNTCDAEFISKAIDELVEPDATIRTPLPGDATGAQLLKEVWAVLLRAFPDLQLTVEDLIGEVFCKHYFPNSRTWRLYGFISGTARY